MRLKIRYKVVAPVYLMPLIWDQWRINCPLLEKGDYHLNGWSPDSVALLTNASQERVLVFHSLQQIGFMKTLFTFCFVAVFFSSCYQLSYLGSTYPATKNVDVYVEPSAIKKPYIIIGKSTVDNIGIAWSAPDKLQAKAVALAAKKGADAILFEDMYLRYDGSNIQSITTSDSIGKSQVITTNGAISPNVSREQRILFLKYQ